MGRRSRFVPIRRKRAVEADPTDDSATAPLEEPSAEHQSGIHWVSKATAALQYFAKLLWLPDYTELFLIEFDQNLRKRTRSLEQWRHASRRNKFAPIAPCQAATAASVWAVGPSVKYCMRDDFSLDFFRALAAPGSQSHHARPRALQCRHQHAEGFLKWCGWPSISKGKARERGRAPGRSYSNLRDD